MASGSTNTLDGWHKGGESYRNHEGKGSEQPVKVRVDTMLRATPKGYSGSLTACAVATVGTEVTQPGTLAHTS